MYSQGLNFSREPIFCLFIMAGKNEKKTTTPEISPATHHKNIVLVCVCVCVCVCSNIFSETTGPIEAKLYVEPPWDRGRKLIQMVQVICCSLLSTSRGAGAFSREFTINLSPQCRAFSRALQTEKLRAPLFPGPVGAGTTNDWCIISTGVLSLPPIYVGKLSYTDETICTR